MDSEPFRRPAMFQFEFLILDSIQCRVEVMYGYGCGYGFGYGYGYCLTGEEKTSGSLAENATTFSPLHKNEKYCVIDHRRRTLLACTSPIH